MASTPSPLVDKKAAPGRQYIRLPVTSLASGADLALPLHVITGKKDGPTLGILTTIHGDETFPLIAVRELLGTIDPATSRVSVAAIPVSNPLAVTVFNRQTPEQHGKTDLHEVFPGSGEGQSDPAHRKYDHDPLLDHVDALIDMHCGGLGGRLQSRADLDGSATGGVRRLAQALPRIQHHLRAF